MVSIKSAQAIYHMMQQLPTPQNLKIFMTPCLAIKGRGLTSSVASAFRRFNHGWIKNHIFVDRRHFPLVIDATQREGLTGSCVGF